MNVWKNLMAVALVCLYAPFSFAAPTGTWTTIDDATGQKRAVVNISMSGNTLSGTIVKVFPQPGDKGVCEKCPGAFKGKKIQGLQILWGLKPSGDNEWSGGQILDPKSGKIYRAKITQNGNKLYVRGYVGISVLGRTQTWQR